MPEARRLIQEATTTLPSKSLPASAALGMTLAEAVRADADYPGCDRATMDGYAISADDPSVAFRVVGEVRAGLVPEMELRQSEAVRIFTGAILPSGAGEVVPQEDAVRSGDEVRFGRRAGDRYIRRRGSEASEGTVVLPQGALLSPSELAALAQVGCTTVQVIPAPTIRHVTTGDELVDPAVTPRPGKIRDTNTTLIAALVQQTGASLLNQDRIGDDAEALTRWVRESDADLLLISGGASVGDYDFGATALTAAGFTIHFSQVNLRPGKPLIFATRGPQCAFVLPGNPVSHLVCFHLAVHAAIEAMGGRRGPLELIEMQLAGDGVIRGNARETYSPARAYVRDGQLRAEPAQWSSSGDTFSLQGTNCLLKITADTPPGTFVPGLLVALPR